MKETLLSILTIILSLSISAQELMKIGEVFNFEIGDEFQLKGETEDQSPNADRITIIGKYYSAEDDTIFYIRYHDSYYTEIIWDNNPYLEYHFGTETDTIYYTNLDSSLAYFDQGFNIDQYIEYSPVLCDILINRCEYASGSGFESDYIINEYGKGLGRTFIYAFSGEENVDKWKIRLFYFKKGELECGNPDTTTVSVFKILQQEDKFTVFPNPANSVIYIRNEFQMNSFQINIQYFTGQIVMSKQLYGKINSIDINHLDSGIYFLQIKFDDNFIFFKFIKE